MQLSGVDLVVPTHGLEGAKAYPLGLNSRVPLFDDTDDVFYIKSTDANGFPTVKRYRFEEDPIFDPSNNSSGISLQDIRSLIREELGSVKEDILNAKQPVSTNNVSENYNESGNTAVVKRSKRTRSITDATEHGQSSADVEDVKEQ